MTANLEALKQHGTIADYQITQYVSDINEPDIIIELALLDGRTVRVATECKNWNPYTSKGVPYTLNSTNYQHEVRPKFFENGAKKPFDYSLALFHNPLDHTQADYPLNRDGVRYVDDEDLFSTLLGILEEEYGPEAWSCIYNGYAMPRRGFSYSVSKGNWISGCSNESNLVGSVAAPRAPLASCEGEAFVRGPEPCPRCGCVFCGCSSAITSSHVTGTASSRTLYYGDSVFGGH
ncbi:MAG: hypothetical protein ABSF00_01960 [Candidatus Bathyarchaeia archaeon]